jgi:hypothetical protein
LWASLRILQYLELTSPGPALRVPDFARVDFTAVLTVAGRAGTDRRYSRVCLRFLLGPSHDGICRSSPHAHPPAAPLRAARGPHFSAALGQEVSPPSAKRSPSGLFLPTLHRTRQKVRMTLLNINSANFSSQLSAVCQYPNLS